MEVNGVDCKSEWKDKDKRDFCRGYMVAPEAGTYEVEVWAEGDHDYLVFSTDSREHKVEDEGGKYTYRYTPVRPEEVGASVPLRITSLHEKGRHAYGFIAFEQKNEYSLHTYLKCDGNEGMTGGVSVCQIKAGLPQYLTFPGATIYESNCDADVTVSDDERYFTIVTPKRECVFNFMSVETEEEHIHWSLGYEKNLIRELD